MTLARKVNAFFEPRKEYGVIFLRLIIGWRLIDGTQDNVFNWDRMVEFEHFLNQYKVPYPLVAAVVSVYAQFICGILYIIGLYTRLAAIVMIINFIVALALVHIGLTFEQSFDALMMLFGSCFFLIHGAGKFSIDQRLKTS
jgi:putative oxidoreductase